MLLAITVRDSNLDSKGFEIFAETCKKFNNVFWESINTNKVMFQMFTFHVMQQKSFFQNIERSGEVKINFKF